ncbi:MAG: TonB-dependent receptor [Gammaproteobacteria bacterium]|nr:MAG: TonB-dependent receptor [Gammaproteobacteria bacterium]
MFTRRVLPLAISMAVAIAPGSPAAQTGEPARRMIDEVVVTAQKREESIQDVPLAVTALSDLQLDRAGVQDIRDLPTLSASFNMNSSQTESQGSVFRIRGVGTTGNNIGLESAVGVFMDGVHMSRPGIALGDLVDVEAIEVLRGPQGTLFGRNTSAGALVVRTKRPDLDNVEAWVNAGFGNFSSSSVQIGGNLPLIDDTLAVRGSVAFRRQDGFMKSATGAESMDRDRISLRGQALWNINDRADLRLIVDYADADEQCCDAIFRVDSPIAEPGPISGMNAFEAAGLPADGGASNVGSNAFNNRRSNADQFENPFEQWGASAELNWDLDDVSITYIGSYRYFDATSVQFSDFVGTDVFSVRPEVAGGQKTFDEIETTTHELRFAGDTDRLQWMVGGFFMWEDIVEGQGLGLGADFSRNTSANLFGLAEDPVQMQAVFEALSGFGVELADGTPFGAIHGADPTNPALAFTGGVDPFGSFANNSFNQTSRSWSIFTHNTFRVTDDFDLVFGLRWVDEDKDGSFEQSLSNNSAACLNARANSQAVPANAAAAGLPQEVVNAAAGAGAITAGFTCFPFVTPADTGQSGLPSEFDLNFSDDELVWTVRGVYRFTNDTMGYASFTHGFKAGGFNLDPTAAAITADGSPADPRFDSETIDSWEVGLKTELFDRRVRVNTALFYQDIEDFQVLEFTGVQFVTFNVPKAESKGVELEIQAAPMDQLDLSFGVTYLDAKYPSDCDAGLEGNATVSALCGNRLTNASDWVGVLGLTWQDRIPGTDLIWFAHTNVRAESKRRTSTQLVDPVSGNPREIPFQGANAKVNARLGFGPEDARWSVELWGNNLTDKQTTNNTFNVSLRGVGSQDTPARASFIEAPRTVGATFRARL